MSILQSILIPKTWSLSVARNWLKDHNYKSSKVDLIKDYWRFRQVNPRKNVRYRTFELPNGIKYILMFKN